MKPNEATVNDLDRLMQENEEFRAKNEELTKRLQAAQEFLSPQWKEYAKLLVIFGEAPASETVSENGDPLSRFSLILEKAPREACRKVARALVSMGGRATFKQLASATGYSLPTVRSAVSWLRQHGIAHKEDNETVIGK